MAVSNDGSIVVGASDRGVTANDTHTGASFYRKQLPGEVGAMTLIGDVCDAWLIYFPFAIRIAFLKEYIFIN